MSEAPVFLFDGVCVFCSRSVAFVTRYEGEPRIRFVAIQSDEGRDIARGYGVDPDDPSTFLFIEHGKAMHKSDGVLALVGHLNWPWRGLRFFRIVPRVLRDWCYDRVARNRYRLFGRRDQCLRPDPALRARFVLPE